MASAVHEICKCATPDRHGPTLHWTQGLVGQLTKPAAALGAWQQIPCHKRVPHVWQRSSTRQTRCSTQAVHPATQTQEMIIHEWHLHVLNYCRRISDCDGTNTAHMLLAPSNRGLDSLLLLHKHCPPVTAVHQQRTSSANCQPACVNSTRHHSICISDSTCAPSGATVHHPSFLCS
jgi:hypothetical protein